MTSALGVNLEVNERLAVQVLTVTQGIVLCEAGEKLRAVYFPISLRALLDVGVDERDGSGGGRNRPRRYERRLPQDATWCVGFPTDSEVDCR